MRSLILGEMVTSGGAVSIFAGNIRNAGTISANALSVDEFGRVQLIAKSNVEIEADGQVSANGTDGGAVHIESLTADTIVRGNVTTEGADGIGGDIKVLGKRVGLFDAALIDASGKHGGGEVLVGGDFQGDNPNVQNAEMTVVSRDAEIRANATAAGDGGTAIVWG